MLLQQGYGNGAAGAAGVARWETADADAVRAADDLIRCFPCKHESITVLLRLEAVQAGRHCAQQVSNQLSIEVWRLHGVLAPGS